MCRAPVAASALPASLVAPAASGSERGARELEARDVDADAWLAAEDMATLRVSQQRWADGVERQRARVRTRAFLRDLGNVYDPSLDILSLAEFVG